MRFICKLASLALALALLGACASTPEATALGERSYRVSAIEQAAPPHQPDMKQGTRQALRQAALLARRNDADYLRVRDIRITESTKKVPGTRNRPMVYGAGLIGALVGELVFAAIDASNPPPPTVTVNVRQVDLDFEITAEGAQPADSEDFLEVKEVIEMTAPFDNDEEQVSDELPRQVRTRLDSALLNVTRIEPVEREAAPEPAADILVIPDRRPDGSIIEAAPADAAAPEADSLVIPDRRPDGSIIETAPEAGHATAEQ